MQPSERRPFRRRRTRKKPGIEKKTIRFLLVAPQGLGDSIETTPLLSELKRARPEARVDVVVLRPGPRELFTGLPHLVERVIELPYWERGKLAFVKALGSNVRVARYAASFLAYPAARPEYQALPWLMGARRRFGHRYFDRPSVFNGLALQTTLVPVRDVHNVERNLDLLRAAGIEAQSPRQYSMPPNWFALNGARSNCIAVHIGTSTHHGLHARRWGAENFARLIGRLRARGFEVALICGPDERELTHEIASRTNVARVVEGSLAEVARYLSSCLALVANDSGIAHMGAGVRTPTLAIFGPTPTNHGPLGENAVAFRPSACPACFDPRRLDARCARNVDYQCLRLDAPVEAVEAALIELIARSQAEIQVGSTAGGSL